jgi:hypothetical protein
VQRAAVQVSVDVHDIYSSSTVHLRAQSTDQFALELGHGHIFEIDTGVRVSSESAASSASGEVHALDLNVTGVFGQKPVESGETISLGGGPGVSRAEYGVRFFPFISSILDLSFRLTGGEISSVVVLVRPEIRLLWDLAKVDTASNNGVDQLDEPTIVIAHSPGGWRQALIFDEQRPDAFAITLPAVASGRLLTRSVLYPLVVWFGSLVTVFAAAQLLNTDAIVAAVGASWTLGLREWLLSERAHQITLGQALLVAQGLSVSIWAAALVWIPTWACVGVVAVLATGGAWLIRTAASFEYTTVLPTLLAKTWGRCTIVLEARRASRRKRLGLSSFDHESRI